jgi:hypothetical protein
MTVSGSRAVLRLGRLALLVLPVLSGEPAHEHAHAHSGALAVAGARSVLLLPA